MYRTKSGEEIFIIDGHTHNWNAAKDNIKNIHGESSSVSRGSTLSSKTATGSLLVIYQIRIPSALD